MGTGAQMMLSNDNSTWTILAYAATASWTLGTPTVNGSKTVYAKFKDVAGNWSGVYPAAITLALPDTTPPTGSILINSGGAAGSGSGASPEAPKAPKEAADDKPGAKDEPPPPPRHGGTPPSTKPR